MFFSGHIRTLLMTYLELFEVLNIPESEQPYIPKTAAVSVRNSADLLQFSIPEGKLFYPEPFIASPSYLHADLPYLHIFQYWYWLWFMFIFLICFFFISFISAVRWCSMRVRPRRETRGVSRSKCGDLITACVPVSWAMSIIVNESTDAIDLNDGFGTAELVVGVRAYQWGWEYYYPKSIDLNYNVRGSYSSFVGNSIRYTSSSSSNLSSNFLWRMYQNEADDRIVTPAHLLLMPSDPTGLVNFLNFKDIGVSTLRESSAFSKIRNFTKVYSTQLVHTPSTFISKYQKLNSLYINENNFMDTSSFGVSKQHTNSSISTLGNGFVSTLLDSKSFAQFLDSNTSLETNLDRSINEVSKSPLTAAKRSVVNTPAESTHASVLLAEGIEPKPQFSDYPTLLESFDDNSDKDKLGSPSLILNTRNLFLGGRRNTNLMFSQGISDQVTSATSNYVDLTLQNTSKNSRLLNINGPNSKVLLNDQSTRNLPTPNLNQSNLNFSLGVNPVSSNFQLTERVHKAVTPYSNASSAESGYLDNVLTSRALSTQTYTSSSHPAVLSSNPAHSNSLSYDSSIARTEKNIYNKAGLLVQGSSVNRKSLVGDVFIGSREKTPKSINTAYWDTFWSTTNSSNRIIAATTSNLQRMNLSLPSFPNYVDYDFRNDQALDMLEELFWEHSFSGYNFYDYMLMRKELRNAPTFTPKEVSLHNCSLTDSLGNDQTSIALYGNVSRDLSSVGGVYGTSTQMEDYSMNPAQLALSHFTYLPFYFELNDVDETFTNFKNLSYLFNKSSTPLLTLNSLNFGARSYISVFNTFRSDFMDFNWQPYGSNPLNTESLEDGSGSALGQDIRLSNPASLRSSVRNSIVNSNAFQKVFKARLDEGRAHVQADSFADLALRQPFLSDVKVPYLQILGKNRNSFFETPLFTTSQFELYNVLTPLHQSLNAPTYTFPFLLSRTSDTSRFAWIDWFSKWKYIEVQPSSVSRYSTLGVPYLRKPFDFNSTTGDKFQDTELYFTRLARSRRNYLTNWSYSPYSYNRSYVWNAISKFDSFLFNPCFSGSSLKATLGEMSWYWLTPSFGSGTTNYLNFSSSGNEVYAKSTWRPRTSIQAYYANVSKLVDILSRREYLYRTYLAQSSGIEYLPVSLCATPNNPLLTELKSSFLFQDPASFGSEFSRDFIYGSSHFIKSLLLQNTLKTFAQSVDTLPVNVDLLTRFAFFYFLGTESNAVGKNSELYKSQFRPLRKGISSMLRLHATGAVAMPIEIRLQVLASSRDVIHSWAIPSAHIKIDCVPGYTSHRIMKFLLTGVYWGQCQEICGRYHHWMPIVVYFMKPDLFVLWCVHFVLTPSATEHYNSANNWFTSPLRTVSQ